MENLVVFVLGQTAAGKTDLSIEIAKRDRNKFEIVNADSMQFYKNTDVMTAKIKEGEKEGVPHHLLSFLEETEPLFNRLEFQKRALEIIEEIHSIGKVPIVVGGTNYYIESLLLKGKKAETMESISKEKGNMGTTPKGAGSIESSEGMRAVSKEEERKCFEGALNEGEKRMIQDALLQKRSDSEGLFKTMELINPVAASMYHRKDKRHLENALLNMLSNESRTQLVRDEQQEARFSPNFIVFLIEHQKMDFLEEKITSRVEKMLKREGGIEEIIGLLDKLERSMGTEELSPEIGVLQSIGYKEFIPFYQKLKETFQDFTESKMTKEGHEESGSKWPKPKGVSEWWSGIEEHEKDAFKNCRILAECQQKLVVNTVRYAKKQAKWLEKRIKGNPIIQEKVMVLTLSAKEKFKEDVVEKALEAMRKHGDFSEFKSGIEKSEAGEKKKEKFTCEMCHKEMMGEASWESHLASSTHKKMKKKIKKIGMIAVELKKHQVN